ncbi:phosphotransferase enzyme family-domain-containing protein [Xylaria telfairii]|nr:phosphotransferase enzyme family-domain-containing protein [Xylaria telfairii]
MASTSHNHTNYQARLAYIQQLLVDHLGVSHKDAEQAKLTPIQYDPDFPFKYNNFVYSLSFSAPIALRGADDDAGKPKQPGCVSIPAGTRDFIVRLSNPDAHGMYQETRVQNEVGVLALASAALAHIKPNVVPRVFGWGSANGQRPGWILQELMPGAPLLDVFSATMSLDQKKGILAQMARLLKGLQDYPLPKSITGWGGVTFDDAGAIVSAPMTTVGAGPWFSLEDAFRDRLRVTLRSADASPHLCGWRENGVRARVDAFIERGLSAQLADLESREDRTIVHADFTPDNLLYDPATGRITALLDYDFASIQHPGYEFFRSFGNSGGQFLGWTGDATPGDREALALREAKLSGRFPSPLPAPVASANGPGVDWELARAWEDELQRLDVRRPSTLRGIDKLADVDELLGVLSPWRLTNDDFLRMNQDEDQRATLRRISERQLTSVLDHMGF